MNVENIHLTYKISRLVFAFFFLTFFVFFVKDYSTYKVEIIVLLIYNFTAFISLFNIKKISFSDFLLDTVFISALIFLRFDLFNYLAILYLFPVFFYAFLSGKIYSYTQSIFAVFSYVITIYAYESFSFENAINILLISFSLFIINYAALKMHRRMSEQNKYISLLEEERKKSEVFKRLYRISADFAHELRNPLTSMLAAVDLIEIPEYRDKMISIIKSEGKRIEDLLNTFLAFSKPVEKNFTDINLKSFVEGILKSIDLDKKSVDTHIRKDIFIYTVPDAFEIVLRNVIQNAVQWAKSKIVINGYVKDEKVFIEIEDDGQGIDKEDMERIFEPFFTKRKNGTGLGLAIAKKYIIELGGGIKADYSDLGGAKFIIWIPLGYDNE